MVEIIKPKYVVDFKCIGAQCEDNCCRTNYNLVIDKKFYKHMLYKSKINIKEAEVFKRLHKQESGKLGTSAAYAEMLTNEEGHCFFVGKDNLCQVYQHDGPEKMPDMCKEYPRLIHQRGSRFKEVSLTLGCPEAVRRLLFYADALDPIVENQPSNIKLNKEPYERPPWFAAVRLLMRDILLIEDASIEENLYTLGLTLADLQALKTQSPTLMLDRIEYHRNVISSGSVRYAYQKTPPFQGATALIFLSMFDSLKVCLVPASKLTGRFFELSTLLDQNIIAFAKDKELTSAKRQDLIEQILQNPVALQRYQDYIATRPVAWINFFLESMIRNDFPKSGWNNVWYFQTYTFVYIRTALMVIALERELNDHDFVWIIQSLFTLLHSIETKQNLLLMCLEVDKRIEATISKTLSVESGGDWSTGILFGLKMHQASIAQT
jgi:lysine-N-methylase